LSVTIEVGSIVCPVCGQEGFISFIRVQHGSGKSKVWHYINEVDLCYAMAIGHPDLYTEALVKALSTLKRVDPERANKLVENIARIIEAYKKGEQPFTP
jgi:hypothetical protein